jgi:hypothetical protein
VLVVADDAGVEAILEEMPTTVVALVEALRVAEVQKVHAAGEVLELGEDDDVEVIRHLAGGEDVPAPPQRGEPLELGEALVVGVVAVDLLAVDAARGHVIDGDVRKNAARQATHGANVATASSAPQSALSRASGTRMSGGLSPGHGPERQAAAPAIGAARGGGNRHVPGTVPRTWP